MDRPDPKLGPRRTSASELSRVKSEQATTRLTLTGINLKFSCPTIDDLELDPLGYVPE